MIFPEPPGAIGPDRTALRAAFLMDESDAVNAVLADLDLSQDVRARIEVAARNLVEHVRAKREAQGTIQNFMAEYDLSSREGIVLMCLAEALLRIPDPETADQLIEDKLGEGEWEKHLGHSDSVLVNAGTWGLMVTGRLLHLDEAAWTDLDRAFRRMIARTGEPVIRRAVTAAMRLLGRQFVMGQTIEEALRRARPAEAEGYRFSYDMLGEAARTAGDAERYFEAYRGAIQSIGEKTGGRGPIEGPGISVKLSALHPRYEFGQRRRVMAELAPRLKALALDAKAADIGFCVDAEEADRLDLSLDLIAVMAGDPELAGWDGFGLAVQAYQKRALWLVDWLAELARASKRRLMVRLVKGAYWDTEIKRAQERGLTGYPVFTRKASTDCAYLACARKLLRNNDAFYGQFATHNAHTLAAIMEFAGNAVDFEFQRLHGMGEPLYDLVVGTEALDRPCRVYAPVGSHQDLLAYLVRRLLENGANSSFVNRIMDEEVAIDDIVADPVERTAELTDKPHPHIPLPADLYGSDRRNAAGFELTDPPTLTALADRMAEFEQWIGTPLVDGREHDGVAREIVEPADHRRGVGTIVEADERMVEGALVLASKAAGGWDATPADQRAACLERIADLYEENSAELMALAVREAGKTLPDALAELREAVDFCRYYALRARDEFAAPVALPGPTGESNHIALHGRGLFCCISPWNFPLAIFTGQVAAALAAGNAVIAKPAEQTSLIAHRAVMLMLQAGIPGDVLHLLPGRGEIVGARLVEDPRVSGVAFTGSTATARAINLALAKRHGPIATLIAETGGQNAMIVDSSALPEQVVADAVQSAFQSAGQRCSALRVLFLQEDVADKIETMLAGAAEELRVGDPRWLATDVGPVIDREARDMLDGHAAQLARSARPICKLPLGPECAHGTFVAPQAWGIDGIEALSQEWFGPILHVVRYEASRLDAVIEAINATGFGLTLGIHSRIDEKIDYLHRRLKVGNAYVNRNMIGAVVGVQPFGGEGLSGTGPKAGGPHYLQRFATERVLSVNTTAAGGNATLLSLAEDEAAE